MKNSSQKQKKEYKGIQILLKGGIAKQSESHYRVRSQSNQDLWYNVVWKKNHWSCNCIDHQKNHNRCKHINAIDYKLTVEDIKTGLDPLDKDDRCPVCGQEDMVVRNGKRYTRSSGPVQRYICKRCNKRFSGIIKGFKGMKNKASIVTSALDLYFHGLSLRKIVQHLETTYRIKISHVAIHYWMKKYIHLITQYTDRLNINVSGGRWLADETILKVQGRHIILWNLLDAESRFLLAKHISQKRGEEDASILLKKGVNKSKEKPLEIVTDGLSSYNEAIKKEIGTNANEPLIHLQGPLSLGFNNRIERYNETIKNRIKIMAGFHDEESAIRFTDGFAIYYNFIKTHTALNDMTPAMIAGIAPQRYDWLDLIKISNSKKKVKTSL